ncbi:hypothetical protein [Bradyrhizobium sp. CCBAU 11434]|uniref:hypothetical protein n=1 Tax=Bradyrhizobium sp. CCBAU 11434 TaxID=1630885 RepID=UPI0023065C21|nr:hypothetical protein [Bradyrhizobium sp. CCBAU 11434]
MIRKTRGVMQIDERNCLVQMTCSYYKLVSGAYGHLNPQLLQKSRQSSEIGLRAST